MLPCGALLIGVHGLLDVLCSPLASSALRFVGLSVGTDMSVGKDSMFDVRFNRHLHGDACSINSSWSLAGERMCCERYGVLQQQQQQTLGLTGVSMAVYAHWVTPAGAWPRRASVL